ncbi:hypothetical protein RR49_02959 [Microbacterium ginsengisoli]|uniref:Uncharacterized protein n=1 Tax=Microbacterium ginsengisoli TaxID=400772 RepID=A0A0F0LNX7_9MICO|nr:hypothetical protein [Microbacterium ginsengisoli]KJL34853.1 hypothetical protein RR49_02742 [Microbacterium ginsengisoli]KJL35062.1 hypothetical protein RR49_02959 [Microbacterium ginsengisoli]MBN9207661.1 hypothetical protein [Microbacterium ginsengisoli]
MTPDSELPFVVDGYELTSYAGSVDRLLDRHPARSRTEIEAVLAREHDAFTGGRPVAIPVAVENGADEVLSLREDDAADGAVA